MADRPLLASPREVAAAHDDAADLQCLPPFPFTPPSAPSSLPPSPRSMASKPTSVLRPLSVPPSGSPDSPRSPGSKTRPRVQIVSLESIIGVGKSTQMECLKKLYADDPTVAFVDEPDEAWRTFGLLEAYCLEKVNGALFQLTALSTMSARFSAALASGATTIVTERSIWSCYMCFSRMVVTDPYESAAYACAFYEIQRALEAQQRFDVTFVYIDVDANVAWERQLERSRSTGKEEVTLATEIALRAQHELFFDIAASDRLAKQCHPSDSPSATSDPRLKTRAVRVDGTLDVDEITEALRRIVDVRQLHAFSTLPHAELPPALEMGDASFRNCVPQWPRDETVYRDLNACMGTAA